MPSPQSISACAVNASERDMIMGTLPQRMVSETLFEPVLDLLFQKQFKNVPSCLTFNKLPTEWFLPCLRMLEGNETQPYVELPNSNIIWTGPWCFLVDGRMGGLLNWVLWVEIAACYSGPPWWRDRVKHLLVYPRRKDSSNHTGGIWVAVRRGKGNPKPSKVGRKNSLVPTLLNGWTLLCWSLCSQILVLNSEKGVERRV